MAIEKAKEHLKQYGLEDRVIELAESSATVQLAAQAVGCEMGEIAKTLSFLIGDEAILILAEGTARIDNHKFKEQFHAKAKMIPPEQVEQYVGHAPGGVCPFGAKPEVKVYLDESLRKYRIVYPAAGNDHSAVRLSIPELELTSGSQGWVNVCKE